MWLWNKIYQIYSGKHNIPGDPPYMSINEFYDLIWETNVVDDEFGQREIGTLYNLSMIQRLDELDDDKHMNMTFVEFLEGIARVAEKLKLPPIIEKSEQDVIKYDKIMKSIESRRKSIITSASLTQKIETFIYMMSIACLPREHNVILSKQIVKFYKK